MCVFGSIYGVIFKRVERRSSFRLGLGGFTLHLALLLTITAATTTAARNGAACGEGEVTTPERERKEFINEKKQKTKQRRHK